MGFYFYLRETLREFPFDENTAKQNSKFNSRQCQTLARVFSSTLDKFFRSIHRQPSSTSSSPTPSRRWRSLSGLYDKTLSRWWSLRKDNPKSNSGLSSEDSFSVVLEELRGVHQGLEELYRVIKEAENFLQTCSSLDWRRRAATIAITTEARDVHIHDLIWCIAGLDMALQNARGAELESWARFSRWRTAECYAQLAAWSAENSEHVNNEELDIEELVSNLQQMKQKYDGMNPVRKKLMGTGDQHKYRMTNFLSQKMKRVEELKRELECRSFSKRRLPECMCIDVKDLNFPSRRHLIGKGAFASVYEASWLGMNVAVKEFAYDSYKDLFEYEASVLVALQSPFIVQLIGWCVDDNNNVCYLVMELVKNNLTSFIEDRRNHKVPLRLPVMVDLMLQISRGMEYLHSKNILHRDLKPSNILVDPLVSVRELEEEGYTRVKLCDFGCAKLKLGSSKLSSQVGTTCYMAPEVWSLQEGLESEDAVERVVYSFEADIYSFSMTCVEIITGERPFADITPRRQQLLQMLRDGQRPSLPSTCPRVLSDIIKKCWAGNPSSRPSFANISMILRHLKLLLMKTKSPERLPECLSSKEVYLSVPVLSFQELNDATCGFTRRVSKISLNSVSLGVLSDGTTVLVQYIESQVDPRQLWAPAAQMFNLRHSNLACLRAVCIKGSQCWLVFEYTCVQGSLAGWLVNHFDISLQALNRESCYRVALGVACGLQFLHEQGAPCTVSPGNILLDEKFEPHILFNSLTPVKQEQGQRVDGLLIHERNTDVLYFGILLEKLLWHLKISGQALENNLQMNQANKLEEIACLCNNQNNVERPSIQEVLQMLEAEDCIQAEEDNAEFEAQDCIQAGEDYAEFEAQDCIQAGKDYAEFDDGTEEEEERRGAEYYQIELEDLMEPIINTCICDCQDSASKLYVLQGS